MNFRIAGEEVWACFIRRDCNKCHLPAFHRISATIQCDVCKEELRLEMPIFSRDHQSGYYSRSVCGTWVGEFACTKLEIP
jgi:hypothetical protein